MKKVRFGIIGCGGIHHTHVGALRGLGDIAELVAVCDCDQKALDASTSRYGVRGYADYNEMVAAADIDAVTVCTPSGMHGDHAIAALNAKKHAISEKPIDISLSKADEMIAAAARNGVYLSSISQSRYGAGVRMLHDWLDAGRFGKIVYGEAQTKYYRTQGYYDSAGWRGTWELDGGGALMNQGVHYVDQLRWAMGKPKSVTARMNTLGHERIDVEDIVSATIEFENGAIGSLVATTCAYPGYELRLEIYGTLGSARLVNGAIESARFVDGGEYGAGSDLAQASGSADPTLASANEHQLQLSDYTRAILEGRDPEITATDGRNALELVLAVYDSARARQAVNL
jgi:UDP-N-acetyl-2-amino-2-deoxyglucuronate dehydrogenase